MKKRALFAGAAVVAITLGIVGMSAFEAHVINVTAQIENALNVPLKAIEFGTVFPQEELDEQFTIAMSDSFVAENRVDDIDYLIKQKPKCIGTAEGEGEDTIEYGLVVHDPATGEFTCADAGFTIMPVACLKGIDRCIQSL